MRADVNVSVRKVGSDVLNTRCEIKNVNSIRFIMQSIEVESQRQVDVWEGGGEVVQETRLFDPSKKETRSMRSKEFAHDYRYFPDPDLLPLNLTQEYVDSIAATLPELPDEKKERYVSNFVSRPMTQACWWWTGKPARTTKPWWARGIQLVMQIGGQLGYHQPVWRA